MPRVQKKYHFIYKTTCTITNRFYIGMHSTDNVSDGYVGSGKRLWYSISKHGKENHICEILEYLPDRKTLSEREKEIVNLILIKDPLCMNLALGGEIPCSIGFVNVIDENGNKFRVHLDDPRYISKELVGHTKGKLVVKDKENNKFHVELTDPRYLSGELVQYSKGKILIRDQNNKKFKVELTDPRYLSGELVGIWKNKKHTEETKKKIGDKNSIALSGRKTGMCWVQNIELNKSIRIKKEDIDQYINTGWLRGRTCHNDESKRKISLNSLKKDNKGVNNGNFNKRWISNINLNQSKYVNKEDLDYYLDQGWLKGKLK